MTKSNVMRKRAEYFQILKQVLASLQGCGQRFDAGATAEAAQISSIAYMLVYDNGRSCKSLASQLQIKDSMPFLSSVEKVLDLTD